MKNILAVVGGLAALVTSYPAYAIGIVGIQLGAPLTSVTVVRNVPGTQFYDIKPPHEVDGFKRFVVRINSRRLICEIVLWSDTFSEDIRDEELRDKFGKLAGNIARKYGPYYFNDHFYNGNKEARVGVGQAVPFGPAVDEFDRQMTKVREIGPFKLPLEIQKTLWFNEPGSQMPADVKGITLSAEIIEPSARDIVLDMQDIGMCH